MSSDASRINAGTASAGLAACMLILHGVLLVLVLIPVQRLPEGMLAVVQTLGVVSFIFTIRDTFATRPRHHRARAGGAATAAWGLLGVTLTALALLVGYLARRGFGSSKQHLLGPCSVVSGRALVLR